MALKLHVIIASTRPVRVGLPVGKWVFENASEHEAFETRFVDLVDASLPLLDEPVHPRLRKYEKPHTIAWSKLIDAADAYIVVTPEYNYGAPPSLLNAFDFLYHEWCYKPMGFVSYGGISGGLRSVQMAKQVATGLRMMPIPEGVPIPLVSSHVKDGVFHATDAHLKSLNDMLRELARWAEALLPMRAPARKP